MARYRRYGRRRSSGGFGRFVKPLAVGTVAALVLGNGVTGNKGVNGAVAAGLLSGFGLPALVAGFVGAQFVSPMLGNVMGGGAASGSNGAF